MQRTVTWLGKPDMEPMPKGGLSAEEARATLGVFWALWDHAAGSGPLREELAGRIAQVAKGISATPAADARKILTDLSAKLKDDAENAAAREAVEAAVHR
jgi:hypothetical protein